MILGRNGGLGLGIDRLQAHELHQPAGCWRSAR